MLTFKANITLISGSYLDISPLSLMPWNVDIQGKHHTDIRKLSGYQSTISDALKCCHLRQTSHWYQGAIWISVHYLWCLEMLSFKETSHWYQEAIWISVHYLWCLEMLSFKAHITLISESYLDISPLSLMPWNVVIQGTHHTDIRKLSGISPLSLMPWTVAVHNKHHTDIRKLSGYQSTISNALKCWHSRQTSHWYQEAIWISVHYL